MSGPFKMKGYSYPGTSPAKKTTDDIKIGPSNPELIPQPSSDTHIKSLSNSGQNNKKNNITEMKHNVAYASLGNKKGRERLKTYKKNIEEN
tara:strand:+ start:523 stop:795 length:273 start_codon:yes stop_codon:yes gene_type:complete